MSGTGFAWQAWPGERGSDCQSVVAMADLEGMTVDQLRALIVAERQTHAEQMASGQVQLEARSLEVANLSSMLMTLATAPRQQSESSSSRLKIEKMMTYGGGSGESMKDWLFSVDLAIKASGESRHDKIISSVAGLLRTNALSWLQFAQDGGLINDQTTWPQFKELIANHFVPVDQIRVARSWLLDIRSGQAGSSLQELLKFTSVMHAKAAMVRPPLDDATLVDLYHKALREELRTRLLLENPATLVDAIQKAVTLERAYEVARTGAAASSSGAMMVQPVFFPPPIQVPQAVAPVAPVADPMVLAAMQARGGTPPDPNACRYCHKLGHWKRDCPKRLANLAAAGAGPVGH